MYDWSWKCSYLRPEVDNNDCRLFFLFLADPDEVNFALDRFTSLRVSRIFLNALPVGSYLILNVLALF